MKKTIAFLIFIFMFSLVLTPVFAEENENSAITNIREKVKAQAGLGERENDSTTSANKKAQAAIKLRVAVSARWDAYNKLITRSGQLLDKLQTRINTAKAAGVDTKNSEALMADARAKLADATTQMNGIKNLSTTAINKNTFKEVQKKLQAIHKDLNIVKQDAAKIISNLKSYNASTRSAEKNTTSSASDR